LNPLPLKPPSGYATAFHSNYDPIFYRFQDIKRRIMACLEDFKSKLGVTHLTNLGCTRSLKSTDPVFHFSADSMGQSSFTFTHLAPEKSYIGCSRSVKVIEIGTNRKPICDFHNVSFMSYGNLNKKLCCGKEAA